jgi:hypothetical protein
VRLFEGFLATFLGMGSDEPIGTTREDIQFDWQTVRSDPLYYGGSSAEPTSPFISLHAPLSDTHRCHPEKWSL